MRNVKRACLFLWLLILTGCSNPVIEGTVKDYFGKPMEGVQVTIEKSAFATVTDQQGKYSIKYSPGTFKVIFSKNGYSKGEMELNLATKDKFPSESIVLVKLPNGPGVYFYKEDKITPLEPNKIGVAGTFMESISGISQLSKIFTTEEKPTFVIYGNQYSSGSLGINKLKFTGKAKVENITGKTESDINMWSSAGKVKVNTVPFIADENLMVVEIVESLIGGGHYAISWGALSSGNPLEASGKNKLVYDFEYVNPKAFSELRETALYLVESISDVQLKAITIAKLAQEIANAGDLERASNLFSQAIQAAQTIKDERGKSSLLGSIAVGLAKAGYYERASNLFAEAIQITEYNRLEYKQGLLVSEFAKAGEYDKAIQMAQAMENGMRRDVALSSIAAELAKAGDHKRARDFVSQATQTVEWWPERSGKIASELATKVANAGEYDRAIKTAQSIKAEAYKAEALSSIASRLANAGDHERARNLFSQAIQTAQTLNSTLSH